MVKELRIILLKNSFFGYNKKRTVERKEQMNETNEPIKEIF